MDPSLRSHLLRKVPITYQWEIHVSRSVARGGNVLNFPREYTRNCLKKAHTTIYLVDSSSGRVFRSPIFTSSKHDEDKFIYSGWIRFVKANSLRFKDKVVLNAKHGNNVLDVHIIRGSQSS
ncbi:hypothetical protein P8452_51298 [Trifolium repens]|nr:hypothetical protein P8452_51298 [Trifolium repens]